MLRARKHAHQARMGGGFKGGGGLKSNERSGSSCGEGQEGERGIDRYDTGGGKKQGFIFRRPKLLIQGLKASSEVQEAKRIEGAGLPGHKEGPHGGSEAGFGIGPIIQCHPLIMLLVLKDAEGEADLQTLSPQTSYCKTKPP